MLPRMPGPAEISIPTALAQCVADAAMADVGYNVNIFDAHGVIIASGKPERIGQVHEGALRALRSGEAFEVIVGEGAQQTGINLPFCVDGEVVGVVGITGPLDEVRPLARLARTSVSLLVQQNLEFSRRRYEALAAALVGESDAYPASLVELAMMQGLDLTRPRSAVLVDGSSEGLRGLWTTAFQLPGGLFLLLPEDVEGALAKWVRRAPNAVFFVSRPHDLAKDGIDEVKGARAVQRSLTIPGPVHHAGDLADLMALMALPRRDSLAPLDSHPELVETLRVFIANNMSTTDTAAQLHIHRNTLLYRLNRIHKLTGFDPRQLLELITLVGYALQAASDSKPTPGLRPTDQEALTKPA
jgi:carbohydrate diacid regulator